MEEAERLKARAEADLCAAEASKAAGHHGRACFQSQRAAEKALESFLCAHGDTSSRTLLYVPLVTLMEHAAEVEPRLTALGADARLLDEVDVPTGDPNGLVEPGVLASLYDAEDAERCIRSARSIVTALKKRGM